MRFNYLLLSIFLLLSSLASCHLINPDEAEPAYIRIDRIDFFDANSQQTVNDTVQKITDVWLYIDGNLQGIYQLPVVVPVLASGEHKIQAYAGIIMNGISATRTQYPFFSAFESIENLVPGNEIHLHPVVTYNQFADFAFDETFEDPTIVFDSTSRSIADIERTDSTAVVFKDGGTYSGKVVFNNDTAIFEIQTTEAYSIGTGSAVFLELNYKCNNIFAIGLIKEEPNGTVQTAVQNVFPSETWNKLYVNLSPEYNVLVPGTKTRIFLGAIQQSGVEQVELYFDNVKLIY